MFIPPPHIQEVNFDNKTKLTLRRVKKIESGNCTHILANGDKEYIVYTDRVLYVKVYRDGRQTDYEKKRRKKRVIHHKSRTSGGKNDSVSRKPSKARGKTKPGKTTKRRRLT